MINRIIQAIKRAMYFWKKDQWEKNHVETNCDCCFCQEEKKIDKT